MSTQPEPPTGSASRDYHLFDPVKLQHAYLGSEPARDPAAAASTFSERKNLPDANYVVVTGSAIRKIAVTTRRSATEAALILSTPQDCAEEEQYVESLPIADGYAAPGQ